jgi:hypothetical protein
MSRKSDCHRFNEKKALFFGFLLITGVCAFSIDFSVSYVDTVRITDKKLYYYGIDDESNEEYDITWENTNGVEYITFNYTGEFLDRYSQFKYKRPVSKGKKRYLILYGDQNNTWNEFLLLYDNNNELAFAQWSQTSLNLFNPESNLISAASELAEGNVTYRARNLLDIDKLQPWAEGSRGPGIGEKIFIGFNPANPTGMSRENILKWKYRGIAFSNGFADYNRPHLYKDNNRVKKIRVHFFDPDGFMDFAVLDTPQIQYFSFGSRVSAKIQIEILEVYKGEKWDDTCVNGIFPYTDIW